MTMATCSKIDESLRHKTDGICQIFTYSFKKTQVKLVYGIRGQDNGYLGGEDVRKVSGALILHLSSD